MDSPPLHIFIRLLNVLSRDSGWTPILYTDGLGTECKMAGRELRWLFPLEHAHAIVFQAESLIFSKLFERVADR